jgi:hypothetical protein
VRESEIKKIKKIKWEKERESEKEGDFFFKMGEGEGEWERRRIIINKKRARDRDNAWEGEEKISLSLWHPSITLLHGMGENGKKNKMSPAFHFEES